MFLNSGWKRECITLPQILEKKRSTLKDFAAKIISVNATNDGKEMETGKVKLDLTRSGSHAVLLRPNELSN